MEGALLPRGFMRQDLSDASEVGLNVYRPPAPPWGQWRAPRDRRLKM